MKLIGILLASLFAIGPPTGIKQVEKTGKVTFSVKKGFRTVNGQFGIMDYRIQLDQESSSSVSGTVNVSSISTANTTRDKHLQKKEWFDAATYPTITLQSKKIIKKSEGSYIGTFELKIKGKTQVYKIPFQIVKDEKNQKLRSTFDVSAKHFDIGGGLITLLVGDKVIITMELPF